MAYLAIAEMFQQRLDCLVAGIAGGDWQVVAPGLRHQLLETALEYIQTFDYAGNIFGVEGKRLFKFVEDADEVEDEPRRLAPSLIVFIRAVDARDRLQEHMVAHRF